MGDRKSGDQMDSGQNVSQPKGIASNQVLIGPVLDRPILRA